MSRIKLDIKLKLFSIIFFIGIPFLIIAIAITYFTGSRNLKATIGSRFKETAEQTASKTSFFVERELQKLLTLSAAPRLINYIKEDSSGLLSMLNQFMANNKDEYKRILITDNKGRVIASTDNKEKGSFKDKDWWKSASAGTANIGDFYTTNGSYTSTGSVEYFADIAVPIIDGRSKEIVGVLKGALSGEWLTITVVNTWIGQSGHTMLITDDGSVAICPLELAEGDKDIHKISDSVMKNLLPHKSGWRIAEDNGHGDKDAVVGFASIEFSKISKLGKWEWFIFVTQDPAEAYAPLYSTLWSIFIFGLTLTVVFSAIVYAAAYEIAKPITKLKKGADIIAGGNLDISLPVSSDDETGQLTRSFNQMVAVIRKKDKEWDNTFNSITDLVVIYDKDYKIIKANKAFAARFNTTPEKLIGRECSDIFPKQDMSWGICSYVKTMETKDVFQKEVYDPNTGGSLMVTVSPLLDESGEFIGAVLVAKDITEYKNLQAQLLHTEKLAAVGELASGIAHELNNPLCGIMGFTELLLQKEQDKNKKDIFAKMFRESLRAQKIIQNLLFFVRASKEEKTPIEVNKLILDTLELKEHEFRTGGINVVNKFTGSLPKVNGNFAQLQQVILNILNNAQMALLADNKDKKEIVIKTGLKANDDKGSGEQPFASIVEILIKDNGAGIPPEHLSKIFNPFFTTKEPGKGTGLGLSISYSIIKEHNGKIYAVSKSGEGAAFHIELPAII